MQIGMMQVNPVLGDIAVNLQMVMAEVERCAEVMQGPSVLVFPELVLTGYPPEDLLLRPGFVKRAEDAVDYLVSFSCAYQDILIVIGGPLLLESGQLVNAGYAISGGALLYTHHKVELPNYGVFDEKRYFVPGVKPLDVFTWHGLVFALSVCEDIWFKTVTAALVQAGASIILNLNASPFHQRKVQDRIDVLATRVSEAAELGYRVSIVYANQVGGQDELVFDGGSMVVSSDGQRFSLPRFETCAGFMSYDLENGCWAEPYALLPPAGTCSTVKVAIADTIQDEPLAEVFQALVLGLSDYVRKNGFKKVVLGLSGGIDSALTLAIAVAALGAESVHAVMMPFEYTAQMSVDDAQIQAKTLGAQFSILPIATIYAAICSSLEVQFAGMPLDTTEENIQARCRGILLMALSNKFGSLVLTTGNKSEMAVGYSTLYGDMAGGFDPIKDLPKTQVYALSRFINEHAQELGFNLLGHVIPSRVIERPPSAELRPDQTDQDSLPDYDVLDAILHRFIELDESPEEIISAGFDAEQVLDVTRKVKLNEHKRRQAPPGIRITSRAFGRDRRYPITARW